MRKNRIGILTWHYYSNFGSALQAYALQRVIEHLGFDVEIINYRNPKFGSIKNFKVHVKYLLSFLPYAIKNIKILREQGLNSITFRRKYLKQTHPFSDKNNLPKYVRDLSAIVYGSDQIWAPNVFNPIYMGEGVSNLKKISYAASIGLSSLPKKHQEQYFDLLSSFAYISIREDEGKRILNSIGIKDVRVVLDPTLLIDASCYKKIERPVLNKNEKFVFCYFLNDRHQYWETVNSFAREKNYSVIGVSANTLDELRMKIFKGLGADQFIWLVNHSQAVFTDSYHGSIFSLLFHKDLYILKRFSDNDPICQNSRIEQLVSLFQIKDRLLESNGLLNHRSIDYSKVDDILEVYRGKSIEFLKNALK